MLEKSLVKVIKVVKIGNNYDVVVSKPSYDSAGLGLNPGLGSQYIVPPAIYSCLLGWSISRCHGPD